VPTKQSSKSERDRIYHPRKVELSKGGAQGGQEGQGDPSLNVGGGIQIYDRKEK